MSMKTTRAAALGTLGWVALSLIGGGAVQAQGMSKENLELMKEIATFYRNPENRSQLAQSDLDALAKLHHLFLRGDRQRAGASPRMRPTSPETFLRQMGMLSLEIYSRSNPGKRETSGLAKAFRERFALSKEQDQKVQAYATSTLAAVEKSLEIDTTGARRRIAQPIPKAVYETVWLELGSLWELALSYCGNGVAHT